MSVTLSITTDFESTQAEVMSAMLFPRNDAYRVGYCIRNRWEGRLQLGDQITAGTSDVQTLLNLPSREEFSVAAESGTKRGNVAGDLLNLVYQDWRLNKPEPSLRAALRDYPKWSLGKTYGDGSALLYSNQQLRRYFADAEPAAHLWAAFRLLNCAKERDAFTPAVLPLLLGVARDIQDFATTFIPKRTKPAKPVIDADTLLLIPGHVQPIQLELPPL